MRMLLYVLCTVGEFVWNEGGVVQLPAPCITLCDFLLDIWCDLVRLKLGMLWVMSNNFVL